MSGSVSMVDGHIDPDKSRMTFEDAKRIRENPTAEDVDNKELHRLIDIAIEKQIPKRAIMKGFRPCEEICSVSYLCPVCKKHINIDKYCYHCGQALDWSDTE